MKRRVLVLVTLRKGGSVNCHIWHNGACPTFLVIEYQYFVPFTGFSFKIPQSLLSRYLL